MWDCGNVAAEGSVVDFVDEDTEEGGSLFTRVGLELRLGLDDEGRRHGGEQTSLHVKSARSRLGNTEETHKNEGGVHVFVILLDKLPVVFTCFVTVLLVESGPEILPGRRESLLLTAKVGQCFEDESLSLPAHWLRVPFPTSTLWYLPRILASVWCQRGPALIDT